MLFTEEYLYEATFMNPSNLTSHYLSHVLQPGEKFNPSDPKFPPMTKKEYADYAEKLSLEKAGKSDDYNTSTKVIGWEVEDGRKVKFRKRSPLYPNTKFCEMVMYVDDDVHGNEIINYMVGRPGKMFRMKKQLVSELDESLTTDEAFEKLNNL